jgi:hypothetical protein
MAGCSGGIGIGGGPDDSWLYPLTVATDVVISDVDGDRRADVLTLERLSTSASQDEGRVLVYRQTSVGVFAAPDVYRTGTYPWRLLVEDVDGDSAPDLVVIDVDADDARLLRQDSAQPGQFTAPVRLAEGVAGYDAAVADLNGDGLPDIALADTSATSARVVMLYQDVSRPGEFLPAVDLPMPGPTAHLAAGDLNQDGLSDLVVSFRTAGGGATPPTIALGYRAQLPGGGLGPVLTLASRTGINVVRMNVADYDGDGGQDLLVYLTPFSSQYRATLIVVRQAMPPGSFLPAVDTPLADTRGLDDAVFADLNRDSLPDVAIAGFFPVGSPSQVHARVNLFVHTGGGAFGPAAVHEMPVAVSRIAAGDVNGDGAVDLVAFAGADGCQVMLQDSSAPGTFSAPRPLR